MSAAPGHCPSEIMRFGTVAIVGRSNVGKTTFLNAALGEDLAIVSPLPQTTRDNLLGVVHRPLAQIAFVDTPGIHRPRSELGRRMNSSALDAARGADAILFILDASLQPATQAKGTASSAAAPPGRTEGLHAKDAELLKWISELGVPCIALANKADLVRPKPRLLPLLATLAAAHDFASVIPTTLRAGVDVERVLEALLPLLPEAPAAFPDDTLTDRPLKFFLAEYVREQVLLQVGREVPHAVAVTIDRVEEGPPSTVIFATLHVEKLGQQKILIGAGGQRIKQIGTLARERIEARLGHRVFLKLFVRVTPQWKNVPRMLAELGYEGHGEAEPLPSLKKGES
jgi:GTP-binding protein Era